MNDFDPIPTVHGVVFAFFVGASPRHGVRGARIWKSNLIVLLVLYPVVYLWGTFVSRQLIDSHGVPVWLSLFVGNLVSTHLLGWWLVPAAFRALDWWIAPKATIGRRIAGYALLAALFAASMGLYALLLAWHWGR